MTYSANRSTFKPVLSAYPCFFPEQESSETFSSALSSLLGGANFATTLQVNRFEVFHLYWFKIYIKIIVNSVQSNHNCSQSTISSFLTICSNKFSFFSCEIYTLGSCFIFFSFMENLILILMLLMPFSFGFYS